MTRRNWFGGLGMLVGGGFAARSQETRPIGRTSADQRRNAELLSGYDHEKYVERMTGYNGQDLQRIGFLSYSPAVRTRVGPRGNYKAGMAMLPDGKLVVAACRFNNETIPEKKNFDIHIYQSSDQGLSWQEIGEPGLHGKEPSLTVLRDGSLVLTAQKGYFGPGAKLNEIPVSISHNGGRTWKTKMLPSWDYPRNLIVEPDGSLTMITAEETSWDGKKPGSPHLRIARSTDGGSTWSFETGQVDWDYRAFGEVASVRLRNGHYLAALRRQIPGTLGEGYEDTLLTLSTDGARTWSKPWQMSNTAEVHAYLIELRDGSLLATYSNYHLPWGVYAVRSRDGGRSWDHDRPIQLALSADVYVGWPVTIQAGDNMFTSYAGTTYMSQPPDRTTCEVVRWTLS